MRDACLFCRIIRREVAAAIVWEDERTLTFLDHRPLFPGHCLVAPRIHVETLIDLPEDEIGPLFAQARLLARAMEAALGAEGSFVAVNNRVSQSVPHLHVHVVPRRKGDGLRGFFWPRGNYADAAGIEAVRAALQGAVEEAVRGRV
jgi:histidine triad (HIT) family protein